MWRSVDGDSVRRLVVGSRRRLLLWWILSPVGLVVGGGFGWSGNCGSHYAYSVDYCFVLMSLYPKQVLFSVGLFLSYWRTSHQL